MDLKYALEAAEEFARIVWPLREEVKVVDLMIHGSSTRGIPNPGDLDMIIIHGNPNLDAFQALLRSRTLRTAQEEFYRLKEYLGKIDIVKLLDKAKVSDLIAQGLFHTSYMNTLYFQDNVYKEMWDAQNNPNFARDSILTGLLWGPATQHYDIPARSKYKMQELVTAA